MVAEDVDEQQDSDSSDEEEWEAKPLRQRDAQTQSRPCEKPAFSPLGVNGEEDDFDPPGEEDIVYAAADFAENIWNSSLTTQGLRQRRPETSETRGGGGILDDDFMLGSERLDNSHPANSSESVSKRTWALVWLWLSICIGLCYVSTPSKASFKSLYERRYANQIRPPKVGTESSVPSDDQSSTGWRVFMSDRSFQDNSRVAWKRYVDHGCVALGAVALKIPSKKGTQKGKPQQTTSKSYEHWYLGVLGFWLPLPYLPQPGERQGTYGVGACLLGNCVCLPDPRGGEKSRKGCWRFRGGKSAALNVVAVPTAILFFGWQFSAYWSTLAAHTTLSLANLSRGRLWVLLTAPFSHRGWGEVFTTAVMLANMIDSFDRTGASWSVFFLLFFGGCWVGWLVNTVLWQRILSQNKSAFYLQVTGASGGLAAQLVFLARSRPSEKFQFSLYMMPMPISLTAWQSLFAHSAIGFFMSRGQWQAEIFSNVVAWSFGWLVYAAWQQHV